MVAATSNSDFAVVIPAYNEGATIRDIATRALAQAQQVFIVDDGSTDNTKAELHGLPITLIEHTQNQGKAASLWHGIQAARLAHIKYIVTLDGDGQHAPEDISLLLSQSEKYPNHIIIGARLADRSVIPPKRYWANRIANFWIAWAAGYPITDSQSGFRVYPVELFNDLSMPISRTRCFVFESEILIKAAQRGIKSHPVAIPAVYAKNARPSHFRGVRDISFITLMVARSLLSRGFYLQGLYRSAIKPHLLPTQDEHTDYDGYLMLAISLVIMAMTFGVSLLMLFIYISIIALRASTQATYAHSVILGKKLISDSPDKDYQLRLERALNLFQSYPQTQFYILGGINGHSTISEARSGRHYLELRGVPTRQIHIEEQSRNTLENLKHLSQATTIPDKNFTLITNRYHLARATMMAKGFGFRISGCAAEEKLSFGIASVVKLLIEAFHFHWYLTGRIYATLTKNQRMLARIS